MNRLFPVPALVLVASAALAHSGVTNPAVMARMDAMSGIGDQMKALTAMARGEVAFDAAKVAAGMEAIAAAGAEIPALFEAPESDPESEAAAAIWVSYPEFTSRAAAMVDAARASAGVADEFDLEEAIQRVGVTCKSCHDSFRLKR